MCLPPRSHGALCFDRDGGFRLFFRRRAGPRRSPIAVGQIQIAHSGGKTGDLGHGRQFPPVEPSLE